MVVSLVTLELFCEVTDVLVVLRDDVLYLSVVGFLFLNADDALFLVVLVDVHDGF